MNTNNGLISEKAIKLCVDKVLGKNSCLSPQFIFINDINRIQRANCKNSCQYTYPYKLFWRLTSKCNLRCKHCYFSDNKEKFDVKDDLSTERISVLIDEIIEMDVLNLILTGGEIFTREDILFIIEKLKSQNIPLSLSTNATLITEEIVQELSKYLHPTIDNVQISIEGATKETHDQTRGKDSFDKAINGIKLLINAGIHVTINTTITANNVNEIPDLYKLANQLQVNKITFSKLAIVNDQHLEMVPDKSLVIEKLAETIALEQDFKKPFLEKIGLEVFDLVNIPGADKFLDKYLKLIKKSNNYDCTCQNGNKAYIDAQGDIYLCHLAANNPNYSIGNIKNKTFGAVWQNRNSNVLFQSRYSKDMVCKKCEYVPICKGGCAFDAIEYYGTILAPSSNCIKGRYLTHS